MLVSGSLRFEKKTLDKIFHWCRAGFLSKCKRLQEAVNSGFRPLSDAVPMLTALTEKRKNPKFREER